MSRIDAVGCCPAAFTISAADNLIYCLHAAIRSNNHILFSPQSTNLLLFGKNKVKKPNGLGFSLKSFKILPLLECTCKQSKESPKKNLKKRHKKQG